MNYRTARLVLGTKATASYTDIKRAFRRRAMETHPDRCSDKHAVRAFTNLTRAYKTLMEHRSHFQANRYKTRGRTQRRCFALERRK